MSHRALLVPWRAAVSLCGWAGFAGDWHDLNFLSQITSLTVGVYFGVLALVPVVTAGRRIEERDPFLRMTIAATAWLVGIVFATLLDADYSTGPSLFMHAVVPVVVTLDVVAVGHNLARATWRHVLALPLLPLAYLVYALSQDPKPYPFLDTSSPQFWPTIAGMLVGIWLAGTLFLGWGRVRRGRPAVNAPTPAAS